MAEVSNPSLFGRLLANFKAYHTKHPIIVAYGIMCTISGIYIIKSELTIDQKLECVSKYKVHYTVLRPDDPKVSMIKRGPIGLDY